LVRQVDAAEEDDMCPYSWAWRPLQDSRDHPHRKSPESRKKSNRKYRISSYGLTQELFDLLLVAQQNS
jgi:hypothetical protein